MNYPIISNHLDISVLDNKYIIFNKITKKTYTIGAQEYDVLLRLDGVTDFEQLSQLTGYTVPQVEALCNVFERIGMLEKSQVKRKFNILRLSLRLMNPNKFFKSHRFVRVLSSILLYGTFPLLVLGILMNVFMEKEFISIVFDITNSFRSPSVIIAFPIIVVVLFFHELGHTIVAKRYGANVPELGVMLYWFMPAAYVNLTGVNLLKKKSEKLLAYSAGIIMNFMLLAIVLILRPFLPDQIQFVISWFIVDTLFGAVSNLFIFLKMDGYIILKEIVEIPNLREKSFQYLIDCLAQFSRNRLQGLSVDFKMQGHQRGEYTPMERGILIGYGLLSALYIPVLIAFLIIVIVFTVFR